MQQIRRCRCSSSSSSRWWCSPRTRTWARWWKCRQRRRGHTGRYGQYTAGMWWPMNPRGEGIDHTEGKRGVRWGVQEEGRRRRWEQSLVFSRCISSLVIHDGLSTPTPGHTRPITSTGSILLASGPITLLTYYMSTDTLVSGVSGVTVGEPHWLGERSEVGVFLFYCLRGLVRVWLQCRGVSRISFFVSRIRS